MNRIKKIISAITALTAAATMMTGVSAATKYREHILLYSYDYKLNKNARLGTNNAVTANSAWEFIFDADGTPCYSLEAGKSAESSIKRNGYDSYTEMTADLTAEQQSQLESILLYSYTDTPDCFGSARKIDFDDFAPKYIATQILVWEVVNGQRSNYYKFDDDWMNYKREFELVPNSFKNGDDLIDCFEDREKRAEVRKYYEEYEDKIKADSKRVTFAADKETALTDKPVNGRYEFTNFKHSISYETNYNSDIYTFSDQEHRKAEKYSSERYTTDMNNVLDEYNISVKNGRLFSRKSGEFKVEANFGMEAEIKLTQKDIDKCGLTFFGGRIDNEAKILYPTEKHREYYVYADGANELAPPIAVTILGDADDNGDIGLSDVIAVSKYNASSSSYPLNNIANADVNHEGIVDILDLSKLIEYNLGKIKEL